MCPAITQAAGPPAPSPLPTPAGPGTCHRVLQQGRHAAPLPPYHSKGQPHGPGVVDDVSSHLGLQEGAFGQAPILVGRDLLVHTTERDQSATENHSHPFLHASKSFPVHVTVRWKGDQAQARLARKAERGAQSAQSGNHRMLPSAQGRLGTTGEVGQLEIQEDSLGGGSCSPRLRTSRQTHDSLG